MNKGEQIGKLDRFITIQRRTLQENATGEQVQVWALLKKVWAAVSYPRTQIKEDETNGLIYATNRIQFVIYETDITERDRVLYNGFAWDVIRVTESGRGGMMIIEGQKSE